MRVLGMALHGSLALAVLSSPMDFMKDHIARGQWIKVSDANSSGEVDLVVDKTNTHSLTDLVSKMPDSEQLRQEPLKMSSIRAASTSQYVATVNYNYAGCKTFFEAFIETADACIYSADNSYSYLLTLNSTHYSRAYYTDKFCEGTSYKSTTRKLVSTCASYALGMIYASSTQLLAVEQQYVLLRYYNTATCGTSDGISVKAYLFALNSCHDGYIFTVSGGILYVTAYANIFCSSTYSATKYTVSSFCRQDSTGYYSTYTVPGLTTIQPIYPPTAYPVVASTTTKIGNLIGNNSTKSSCFAGSEILLLESGRSKPISEINVGDRILAADSMGRTAFSEVIYLPHRANQNKAVFIQISTSSGRDLLMTPSHVIPSGSCEKADFISLPLIYASQVQADSCVMTVSGLEKVTAVRIIKSQGLYTVVTQLEYVVVNGIIASPFGSNHMIANLFYNIHRAIYSSVPRLLSSTLLHSANEAMGVWNLLLGYSAY